MEKKEGKRKKGKYRGKGREEKERKVKYGKEGR